MSASDASSAWNLRCRVREKLIEFIQKNYPEGLPKVRAEIHEAERIEVLPGGSEMEDQGLAKNKDESD